MLLIQVQLQDTKTGETEFIEQFGILEGESEYPRVKDILNKHGVPPEGKVWLVCNERSEHFKWMKPGPHKPHGATKDKPYA